MEQLKAKIQGDKQKLRVKGDNPKDKKVKRNWFYAVRVVVEIF